MKVALYARVSTRDRDQNPETQLYALREYAQRHEMEVMGEYVDQASAGDLRRRARWRQLVAAAGFKSTSTMCFEGKSYATEVPKKLPEGEK